MQRLEVEVQVALRQAERDVAVLPAGSREHREAVEIAEKLRTLHEDVRTAARLGVTDSLTFRAELDQLRGAGTP